jgi:tRNA-dihydrouridine synthase B
MHSAQPEKSTHVAYFNNYVYHASMFLYSAPMAAYTNYAYRELLRLFGGVDMIFTEMVSARAFAELEIRGMEPPSRLWGIREEPRPLAVQIWDNDPDTLASLAHRLAFDFKVSTIDLNFGCPAKQIAGKSASGSFLLQFPDRIGDIVRKVVDATTLSNGTALPVTAKIRLGRTRDTINAIDVAQAVESAGAAGITIHGRTAADMYRGQADWEEIAKVKSKLRVIPLIGNGDIRTVGDALFRIRNYPVDGIMIGRGGIAKPWLFRQIAQTLRGEPADTEPSGQQISEIIHRHFAVLQRQFSEQTALMLIRKTVCHYVDSKPGARKFRNDVCSAKDAETFFKTIRTFFDRQ